ncbi:hypothetical protein PoB_005635600 [Plakobranchus ocellatus]|uniref:Uncharacterized protein n=1 Tax=Plakobranchus ocellatus TaxID=259542 RepID=A0AAV4CER2_9GAST|nr:hypothetical protein PoB_005635600 [Plakobranchus ocellatus]
MAYLSQLVCQLEIPLHVIQLKASVHMKTNVAILAPKATEFALGSLRANDTVTLCILTVRVRFLVYHAGENAELSGEREMTVPIPRVKQQG